MFVIQRETTYLMEKGKTYTVTSYFKERAFGIESDTKIIDEALHFSTKEEARYYRDYYIRKRKCDKLKIIEHNPSIKKGVEI